MGEIRRNGLILIYREKGEVGERKKVEERLEICGLSLSTTIAFFGGKSYFRAMFFYSDIQKQ